MALSYSKHLSNWVRLTSSFIRFKASLKSNSSRRLKVIGINLNSSSPLNSKRPETLINFSNRYVKFDGFFSGLKMKWKELRNPKKKGYLPDKKMSKRRTRRKGRRNWKWNWNVEKVVEEVADSNDDNNNSKKKNWVVYLKRKILAALLKKNPAGPPSLHRTQWMEQTVNQSTSKVSH